MRKVFYIGDKIVSAAGCLFYKKVNNDIYLLLIKYEDPNWPLLDDFGGKVDIIDNTIEDTIIRELREETNNIINTINTIVSFRNISTYITDTTNNISTTSIDSFTTSITSTTSTTSEAGSSKCKLLFYNGRSKYVCMVYETEDYEDCSVFGDIEESDNIRRTINWYKWPVEGLAQRIDTEILKKYFNSLTI